MRMESSRSFHLTVAISIAFLCLINCKNSNGQIPNTGKAPSVGKSNPFEPSPFIQYAPTKKTPFQNNARTPQLPPTVTKKVDLRQTLNRYAKVRNCSLNEAFAETVTYLNMAPIRDFSPNRRPLSGTQAIYKIIEKDIYQITASQSFFDNLPHHLMCLENGKRHIVIEARFLSVAPNEIDGLQDFMIPDSFEAYTNRIPQAKPFATQATYRNSQSSDGNQSTTGTFVIATETKTKVYPSFIGRLNQENLKRLLARVKKMPNAEFTQPPRITMLPGQTASISDTATKPVVVGMNRIVGNFATAHQPIVQTLENGTVMQLRATGENGNIRLDGDLALGEVLSVDSFQYPRIKNDENEPVSVAVPEFKVREVHWSTAVKPGNTILIDPVFTKINKTKNGKRRQKDTVGRVVILITPRWVDVEPKLTRRSRR